MTIPYIWWKKPIQEFLFQKKYIVHAWIQEFFSGVGWGGGGLRAGGASFMFSCLMNFLEEKKTEKRFYDH